MVHQPNLPLKSQLHAGVLLHLVQGGSSDGGVVQRSVNDDKMHPGPTPLCLCDLESQRG